MTEVRLHIYDVTSTASDKTNHTFVNINKIFKDRIGLGGIFHSAIQVYGDDEWSFGFCERGSGVFRCPSGKNPLYKYRESLVLGRTDLSISKVNQILRELSREWPGTCYDLLSKNCNHFCDELCERLGVQKLPGWVNRFANTGDAAVEMAENTALRLRQAKTKIVSASKVAYRFLVGVTSASSGGNDPPRDSNRQSPKSETAWFKNLVASVTPSSSSEVETRDDDGNDPPRDSNRQCPKSETAWFKNLVASVTPSSSSEVETRDDDVVLQHQWQHSSAETMRQTYHNSGRPPQQSSHSLERTLRPNLLDSKQPVQGSSLLDM